MSELQAAGDSKSHSEVWDEVRREEEGQAGKPPETQERPDPLAEEGNDEGQPGAEEAQERQGPDAEQPAGSESADDIWANADPVLKAAFEAERAKAAKAENTIRSNNGRWSKAQQELNALRARQQAPAQPQASGGKDSEPAPDDAELRRVEEEYSDIAKPFVKAIAELRSEVASLKQDASRRGEFEAKQAELAEQESLAREEQALAEDHPDWNDVVKSQDFADWALAQPRMVHEALRRNANGIVDGAEASKIIADFKRDTRSEEAPNPLAQKRVAQMEGARHVPAKAGAAPGQGQGGSYSDEWKRLAAEEQRREASRK